MIPSKGIGRLFTEGNTMKVHAVIEVVPGQEAHPVIHLFKEAKDANDCADRIKDENGPDWEDNVWVDVQELFVT
ncbi:hypothetical protein mvi_62300 (plasmid) [Methylobacterium indicum]|uniref:Uncharacterized protein n=2 Tax=Methylobacterium indicum TaxID=1775910 RepID=A0A8H8X0K3_9HYPH|nr:hypothetical protein mvi_62300 [Methylobacterium indicum]